MRKLVQIKTVTAIEAIEGADMIECATINEGWKVVVKKGEFLVGSLCVYHEIDSFLPLSNPSYAFLAGRNERVFNGATGVRLRTIKLRGCISQGLALSISSFPEVMEIVAKCVKRNRDVAEIDLSYALNVIKWEAPVNAQLAGDAGGGFPYFIRKTYQERAQNLAGKIFGNSQYNLYEVTLKLDGSSMTGFIKDGVLGVCSRNLELKLDGNDNNSFVKMFMSSGLARALELLGRNLAVQGELMGPGIQGNREKFNEHELFIFDVWDIDKQNYLRPEERKDVVKELILRGFKGSHVPVVQGNYRFMHKNMQDLLDGADGESINNSVREGLVYKSLTHDFTFKTISNKFLLKGGE